MTFESPATTTAGPKPADLQGHLLIIAPTSYETGIQTSLGEAEAIRCNVTDLDTNEEHSDVLFFNTALRSGLKSRIGSQVLTRIGQGVAKPGKSAPWILLDATTNPDDISTATAYIAAKTLGGIVQPAVPQAVPASPALDVNDPAVAALIAQLAKK